MPPQFQIISKEKRIIPAFAYCCIAIFFLFKLSHLHIPYFWDELGFYSKAALFMHDTKITLLPGVLDPELSRGHPLLCAAFFAAAFRLLGPSVWAGHLAALAVSVTLLAVVYRGGAMLSRRETGLLACLLLMLQPVFIAQSGMVLPEVMLALFSTAALIAYLGNRLTLFALFACLAIMTKETGIALPVTVWSIEILRWFAGKRAEAVQAGLAALVPVGCLGLFLLLQKWVHGWFLFPLHTGYVSFSPEQIIPRLGYYLSFLLKGQGRLLWTVILASALLVYLLQRRHALFGRIGEDVRLLVTEKKPILVFSAFLGWGLVVSMLNFHLGRYSLFLLPSLCFLVALSFLTIIERLGTPLYKAVLVVVLLLTPLPFYASSLFSFDADMGFVDAVDVHTQAADFLNSNYDSGTAIMDSHPITSCMIESRSGYNNSRTFRHLDKPCLPPEEVDASVFVYSYPGNLEQCTLQTKGLSLVREFSSSFAKVLIYEKK